MPLGIEHALPAVGGKDIFLPVGKQVVPRECGCHILVNIDNEFLAHHDPVPGLAVPGLQAAKPYVVPRSNEPKVIPFLDRVYDRGEVGIIRNDALHSPATAAPPGPVLLNPLFSHFV